MSSVIGFLNLLENTKLDREQLNLVNISKRASKHLEGIVNDLLDISKIEVGILNLESSRFDIPEVFDELKKTLALKAAERRLDSIVKSTVFCHGSSWVMKSVHKILINLLENALKYWREGSIGFSVSFKPRKTRHIPVTIK